LTGGRTERALTELAQLHGIQLGYTDADGRRVRASPDTLRGVLRALGHPADDAASIDGELSAARERANRTLEPVVVAERHGGLSSPIRLRPQDDAERARVTVTLEDGATSTVSLESLTIAVRETDHGTLDLALDLSTLGLRPGYHRLALSGVGKESSALLLVPPPAARHDGRSFGAFAPLYALRGSDDWGTGSYGELADFADLVGSWGGDLAGTLPLYAAFFRDPVDPSPYLPVSRLFWNELYIDIGALPELAGDPTVAAAVTAAQPEIARLRSLADADTGAVMALKRTVLLAGAHALVSTPSDRRDEFDGYVKAHPQLEQYADFRATDEVSGIPWQAWPMPAGRLPAVGGREDAVLYHRYVQFVAAEQLTRAASRAAGLYLDLPVGVHPDGYDTWSNGGLFGSAEVGAPPDPLSADGQAWGFPPLHPERVRENGYHYLAEVYRTVMRHARAVRIDHVLGLQRVYWIPEGAGRGEGAYVRYRSEEARAVIAIEAQRSETLVVGEDLGTVSPSIRRAMDRDGMLHTFVYQFEASPANRHPQPKRPSMASLGGHDLPRFASFWPEFGGTGDTAAALRECLGSLAAGPAPYVMLDLGDLLGDAEQDNRPGTGPEAGNWRHRMPLSLPEVASDDQVADLVSMVRSTRQTASGKGTSA
jgi:4-alpha-glucanotransferase